MANAWRLDHPATYADLASLPEGTKGEIIDGVMYTQPRPRFRHGNAALRLGAGVLRGFGGDRDGDGPGGWWTLVEPGIELPNSPEVAPDLAGWRRDRFQPPPPDEPIRTVPDWVCEILSPSNRGYDRRIKFPFYARVGIPWLWVVDLEARTVEIKRLVEHEGAHRWSDEAVFADAEPMRAPPFAALEIPLGDLWIP